jgi:hypothetical protein
MIRYGRFDPFNAYSTGHIGSDVLYLPDGLPFEILRYLLQQDDFYATPEQRVCFADLNILRE